VTLTVIRHSSDIVVRALVLGKISTPCVIQNGFRAHLVSWSVSTGKLCRKKQHQELSENRRRGPKHQSTKTEGRVGRAITQTVGPWRPTTVTQVGSQLY
jgi:hypothetical protein